MSDKQERIAKLPKWAQNEIQRLNANLEYQAEKLRQMEEGDTNVFIQTGEDDIALPRDANIRFMVGDHWSDYLDIRHNAYSNTLDIYGGGREAIVFPRSSNHIQVGLISE